MRKLSMVRQTVLDELGRRAENLDVRPFSVVVFGSFARGEADAESDLDVVFVRPQGVTDEDERWAGALDEWRSLVA